MNSLTRTALTVAPGERWFRRNGIPHVPLVDTVWNAFAETDEREWDAYLGHRRSQGFTGVLVSALPTWHDRSENADGRAPYAVRENGGFDFDRPNADYFDVARERMARIADHGLTPFLVVLWSNYVAGSPANSLRPDMTLPESRRHELVEWIIDDLCPFEPVLLLSGDDNFSGDESLRVYRELLDAFAVRAPHLPRSFHLWPDGVLPDELAVHPGFDFVTLQSGHTADDGAKAIELAQAAEQAFPDRPILNLEPCYEGHGHVRSTGRFSREEVRRVLWTSLTAGAPAGLGYGAHGVWSWHREGSTFLAAEFSGPPFPWQVALGFEGATDAAFARRIWEDEGLFRCASAQHLLARGASGGARAAVTADRIVVFIPSASVIALHGEVSGARGWDLSRGAPFRPVIREHHGATYVDQPAVNADVLLILDRSAS